MDLCSPISIMHSYPERLDSKFGTTVDLATSCNLQDPRTLVLATRRGRSLEDKHAESGTIAYGTRRDLVSTKLRVYSDYID